MVLPTHMYFSYNLLKQYSNLSILTVLWSQCSVLAIVCTCKLQVLIPGQVVLKTMKLAITIALPSKQHIQCRGKSADWLACSQNISGVPHLPTGCCFCVFSNYKSTTVCQTTRVCSSDQTFLSSSIRNICPTSTSTSIIVNISGKLNFEQFSELMESNEVDKPAFTEVEIDDADFSPHESMTEEDSPKKKYKGMITIKKKFLIFIQL